MKTKQTYVTLISTDDFTIGAVMLYLFLKKVKTKYPFLVLCGDKVSNKSIKILDKYNIQYKKLSEHMNVNTSDINKDAYHARWSNTFDKLLIWTLTEFDKIVYLDCDMQVIKNLDYLFDSPHMSAVIADQWNEPGLDKPENVSPVSVIHYMGARKPWMVSMVAALRRTKRNFLGKELLKYLLCLYVQFPTCLLPKKLRKL